MKTIRILFILIFSFLLLSNYVFAQSSSVYSSFGIGDVEYSFSSESMGMGETGVANSFSDNIELINPATWYKLNQTRFNLGIYYRGTQIKNNSNSGYNDFAQINGFTFGIPVSKEMGISAALGIVPYSTVSYKIVQNGIVGGSGGANSQVTYQGSGGLSKTFIGASYKLPIDLVLGATLDYYFGKMNYAANTVINGQSSNSISYNKQYNPSGLGTTVGLLLPDLSPAIGIKNISNIRIGASINYFSGLRTDSLVTASSSLGTDTINSGSANMKIPMRISAGVSFAINQDYLVSLDIVSQPWQDFSYSGVKSNELKNSLRFGAGFEFHPKLEIGNSFWEQIIWRSGLSYEQTQYKLNNTGINQVSVSGGVSVPLTYANYIDLDFQYAIRGTTNSNLVRENIFTFNLGINLGELWFIRQDY